MQESKRQQENRKWWSGGDFDGEGSLFVRAGNLVVLSMTKAKEGMPGLECIREIWGEHIYQHYPAMKTTRESHPWVVTGEAAVHVARLP